jgi:hypothetical protein
MSARQIREERLREMHPDWSDEEIARRLREIFLYARS